MLTEIMLEGTNSIIYEISSETLSKYRKKGSFKMDIFSYQICI